MGAEELAQLSPALLLDVNVDSTEAGGAAAMHQLLLSSMGVGGGGGGGGDASQHDSAGVLAARMRSYMADAGAARYGGQKDRPGPAQRAFTRSSQKPRVQCAIVLVRASQHGLQGCSRLFGCSGVCEPGCPRQAAVFMERPALPRLKLPL